MNYLVEELIQHLDKDDLMARAIGNVKDATDLATLFKHHIDLFKRKVIELIKQYPVVSLADIIPRNGHDCPYFMIITVDNGGEFYSKLYVNSHFNDHRNEFTPYWVFDDDNNRRWALSHDGKIWSVDDLTDTWTKCDIDIQIRSIYTIEDWDTCRFFNQLKRSYFAEARMMH